MDNVEGSYYGLVTKFIICMAPYFFITKGILISKVDLLDRLENFKRTDVGSSCDQ